MWKSKLNYEIDEGKVTPSTENRHTPSGYSYSLKLMPNETQSTKTHPSINHKNPNQLSSWQSCFSIPHLSAREWIDLVCFKLQQRIYLAMEMRVSALLALDISSMQSAIPCFLYQSVA